MAVGSILCAMIGIQEAMGFAGEPDTYGKTALSDLQGTWTNLREEVVRAFGRPNSPSGDFSVVNPNQLTEPDQ